MKNFPARLPPWSAKAVNDVGRVCCNADSVSGTACNAVRGAGATCEMGVTNAAADPAHSSSDAVLILLWALARFLCGQVVPLPMRSCLTTFSSSQPSYLLRRAQMVAVRSAMTGANSICPHDLYSSWMRREAFETSGFQTKVRFADGRASGL